MITSLVAVALLSAPPSEAYPIQDRAAPGRHAARAHETLKIEIQGKLVPNLRAYKSLSDDLVSRLAFMDDVADIVDTLDRIRRSPLTRSLESSIPGFGWITTTWDELRELVTRTEKVRTHLTTLNKAAADLLDSAERYAKSPDSARLATLLLGYRDAELTFRAASQSFGELQRFTDKLTNALKKSRVVITKLDAMPLVGDRIKELGQKIDGIVGRLGLVREVLKLAVGALDRDRAQVESIQDVIDEAEAHDAYDLAETMQAGGRPGSALLAYQSIHGRWPDTQWAHRADRKIVEAVGAIDALELEVVKLRQDVVDLRTEATRARRAEESALAAANAPRPTVVAATDHAAGEPAPVEPARPTALWIVLGALVAAVGTGAVLHRRRSAGS